MEENIRRGSEAMERVIAKRIGIENAMWRDGVGGVSLLWGRPGKGKNFKGGWGVSHIIAKRNSKGYDGEAVAKKLVEVIAYGKQTDEYEEHGKTKINIDYNGYRAILSQVIDIDSNRRTWLLTGFSFDEKKAESDVVSGISGPALPDATLSETTPHVAEEVADSTFEDSLPSAGEIFKQLDEAGKQKRVVKAATAFGDGQTIIELFQAADRSSFLHEMGHFFLESRRRLSLMEGIDERVREDWTTTVKWLDVADIDFANPLSEEDAKRWETAHEKWAAAVEKYLMEGKAPSAALARAFRDFKKWMIDIYRAVKNVVYFDADGNRQTFKMSDEIRGVMDRLLASEEEIEASRAVRDSAVLAEELKKQGIPDDVTARYKDLVEQGAEKAKTKLFRKLLGELKEEKRAELAEQRKEIRKRIAGEVWERPEYKALKLFRTPRDRGGLRLSVADLGDWVGDGIQSQTELTGTVSPEENRREVGAMEIENAPGKAWPKGFPEVAILADYKALKSHPDYEAAKGGDIEAAERLIQALRRNEIDNLLMALAEKHQDAVLLAIHAVEATGKNEIPQALADYIGKLTGLEVEHNVVQTNVVGHTNAGQNARLYRRPKFNGQIQRGRKYILVDDMVTMGGTFGEARRYVESGGGLVVDMVSLSTRDGKNAIVAMAETTRLELERTFGVELSGGTYDMTPLNNFLKESEIYGGNYEALTESEAKALIHAKGLDEARNRRAKERQADSSRSQHEILPESDSEINAEGRPEKGGPAYGQADAEVRKLLNELPTGVVANDGLAIEEAAELAGYPAGEALIGDLKKAKALPPQTAISQGVNAEMAPLESAANDPEALLNEAEEALHGEGVSRPEWIAMEEQLLREAAGKAGKKISEEEGKEERKQERKEKREAKEQEKEDRRRGREESREAFQQANESAKREQKAWAENMAAQAKAAEETAKKIIRGKSLRDATAVGRYMAAERRAAAKAYRLALDGQYAEAADEKRRQLIEHALAAEAMRIKKDAEKGERYLKKIQKDRKRLRRVIGEGPFSQIMGVLHRTGFISEEDAPSRNRERLSEWMTENIESIAGRLAVARWIQDLDIRNERLEFSELSAEKFFDVIKAVKMLDHLGRNENKLLADKRREDFQGEVQKIADTVRAGYGKPGERSQNPKSEKPSAWGAYAGGLDRPETIVRLLDDLKDQGPVWTALYKPMKDASDKEIAMSEKARKDVAALFDKLAESMGKAEAAKIGALTSKMDVDPRVSGDLKKSFNTAALRKFLTTKFDTGLFDTGAKAEALDKKLYWTGENILAVMLNCGNSVNIERVVMGWGLHGLGMDAEFADSKQYYEALETGRKILQDILNRLSTDDMWDFAQGVWDMLETYWPEIKELEMAMTGVAPEKVEASPVRTASGRVKPGGYYTIRFDASKSWKAATREELDIMNANIRAQGAWAHTRHGHTEHRAQRLTGMPVLLELSVIGDHLTSVIHDLSYRAAVRDLNKLTKDDTVRTHIIHALGEKAYRQFDQWIKDLAGNEVKKDGPLTSLLRKTIGKTAAAQLGMKITTGLGNLSSVSVAMWRLEMGGTFKNLILNYWFSPRRWREGVNFASESSAEVRARLGITDRNIRRAIADITENGWMAKLGRGQEWFGEKLGGLFMSISKNLVTIPVWNAAYEQGLKKYGGAHEKAVDHADWVIRSTQNTNFLKDKSAAERDGIVGAVLTLYFSQYGSKYGMFREEMRRAGKRGLPGVGRMVLFGLWVFAAESAFNAFLKGMGPEDDDKDGERGVWDWVEWFGVNALTGFTGMFPIINGIVNSAFAFGGRNYRVSPVVSMGDALTRAAAQVIKDTGNFLEGEEMNIDVKRQVK